MRKMADQDEDASRVNEARAQLRRQLNLSQEALQRELNPNAGEQVSSRPVKPGDTVQIKSMGMKATVVSKSPDGTLNLRAGIMNVSAKEDEVLLLENEQAPRPKSAPKGGGGQMRSMTMSPELDIRGMEALEGVLAAERYLDSAVMAKLKTVTIIHGKGTGAVRAAVHDVLRRSKQVKSFRLGRYGEGEDGVTVVTMK
jgi:DNA mismatch repair protein MutS2